MSNNITKKIQYWKNGILMGLVSPEVAGEIKENAREAGFRVYDNGHYFTVEDTLQTRERARIVKGEIAREWRERL